MTAGGLSRTGVRIVVVGDRGTGKSSIIAAAAGESLWQDIPPVLPPTHLPADYYPDNVPIVIIDTSSSLVNRRRVAEELKRADAIVLTYACDQPSTFNRLSSFWLQELRRLEVKAPVIVAGCKLDTRAEEYSLSAEMSPLMKQFGEIAACIECSAAFMQKTMIPQVFYFAQKAVLHPTAPLFDPETKTLKPRCMRALMRIFILCDRDMDGALNDRELNEFQIKCFNDPFQPQEIVGVKRVVQEKLPEGVNAHGLTFTGFLFVHALFIEKGRIEATWTVLRKFGYDDDLKLRDDCLKIPYKKADQSVELTSEAVDFLKGIFSMYDDDKDGFLHNGELEDLFSTAPESPWDEAPYKDVVQTTPQRGISISEFLYKWALMTSIDPAKSLANLIYLGFNCGASSALHITRRRSIDRKMQQGDRNVFQCFVFGPKNAGKSALLTSLSGRPFSENYTPTVTEQFSVNEVKIGGNKRTLILREVPDIEVKKLLSDKKSLAACDVAIFVYDSSKEDSLKGATELLLYVARQGERTGYGVPSLLIAAKNDLGTDPVTEREAAKICAEMGIDAAFPLSVKERDLNDVFSRIVRAAQHPHLSVPETILGRNEKIFLRLVHNAAFYLSVGAAATFIGLTAYQAYAARKSNSS